MSDEKNEPTGKRVEATPAVVTGMDGRFARVTPSLYLDGGVVVALRNGSGESTVNAITFTADEWDALYAAGNRALGRHAPKARRLIVQEDRPRIAAALGCFDDVVRIVAPRTIETCGSALWAEEIRALAQAGIHEGLAGWEIES